MTEGDLESTRVFRAWAFKTTTGISGLQYQSLDACFISTGLKAAQLLGMPPPNIFEQTAGIHLLPEVILNELLQRWKMEQIMAIWGGSSHPQSTAVPNQISISVTATPSILKSVATGPRGSVLHEHDAQLSLFPNFIGGIALTNDCAIRDLAKFEVHGSLWHLARLVIAGLITERDYHELCNELRARGERIGGVSQESKALIQANKEKYG